MKQSVRNTVYSGIAAGLVIALFVFAMIEGGFVSWFLVASLFLITLYIVLAYLYPIHTWKVERISTETTYTAGDDIHMAIHIKRAIPFPLFYAFFEEELPSSLQRIDQSNQKFQALSSKRKEKKKESFIGQILILFKRSIKLQYTIPFASRGAHELHTITVHTSDLLGCIKKEVAFPSEHTIHVYPKIRPLTLVQENTSFQQGEERTTHLLKGIQSTLSSSVREYTAGDRLSWIDWKQTAKKSEMMTKEFERERDVRVLLILDHQAQKEANELAFEGAVETVVALVHYFTEEAIDLDVLSVGQAVDYMEIDQAGMQDKWLSEHMMQVQLERGFPFVEQMKEYTFQLGKRALTCVVTTHVEQETVHVLKQLKEQMGEVLFIYITATDEQTNQTHALLEEMKMEGIGLCVLTEKELIVDPLEVVVYGTNE